MLYLITFLKVVLGYNLEFLCVTFYFPFNWNSLQNIAAHRMGHPEICNVFPWIAFFFPNRMCDLCTSCTLSSRSEVYFPDLPVDKPYFVIRDYWNNEWTEGDILSLAAGVESNTNHPLGKAIMEAAQAANCINMKVLTAEMLNKSEIK